MTESMSCPPVLSANGKEYEEWKKMIFRWVKFTNFKKSQHAGVISCKALSGEARSVALAIPDEDLESG